MRVQRPRPTFDAYTAPDRSAYPAGPRAIRGESSAPPDACRPAGKEAPLDAFELKMLVRALLLPPAGPLLLVVAGVLLLRRRPVAGRRAVIAGLMLAWLTSTYWVGAMLTRWVEADQRPLDVQRWEAARDGPAPPRAIVVLGGGAVSDGAFAPKRERLHARSLERVTAGARLARATGLPVLVSGGRPEWLERSEAALMRQAMEEDLGVPVRWAEEASRDTAENAGFSAALLRADGIDSVVLVTHAFHMARARRTFEAAGLTVLPAPHGWNGGRPGVPAVRDLLPSASAGQLTLLAVHELLGGLWYRLRGYA
jgi:uncharacterized SAM-binding protein YcdF (DUF218 family)